MTVTHRTMTLAELKTVLDWAADEGWNPGQDDAAAFHAADPQGFFVAVENGTPLAAISVVNHTPEFAFLGLYLCRPDRRGQGIGYSLWQTAMAHARDRSVGLDGVPAQQANYAQSGFVRDGTTVRFTGVLPGGDTVGLRAAQPGDIDALIAREAAASGVAKPRFLRAWFGQTPTRRTFVGAGGMVTVRLCKDGGKVGPLVAASVGEARTLFAAAAAFMGDAPVSVDVPQRNAELTAICLEMGLEPGFETARMYRGPAPSAAPGLYAVATLELG